MKAIAVIPTIREGHIKEFLQRWNDGRREFIVVEDHPERQFDIAGANITHYCHADIEHDLGKDAWIIPRRISAVRSYGIWKAWQRQPDMIVTMDDDCYPPDGMPEAWHLFADHWMNLEGVAVLPAWHSTTGKVWPRGHPYWNVARKWRTVVSHGLWENVPDLDAVRTLAGGYEGLELLDVHVPAGAYFPMCTMNLAFRAEIAPLMYFGLQGPDWPYDRFDDIWCGVLLKKVLDRFGLAVWSGHPHVRHERASDVWANLRKEAAGLEANETFWQAVDGVTLTEETPLDAWVELCGKMPLAGDYWCELRTAQLRWAGLFQ